MAPYLGGIHVYTEGVSMYESGAPSGKVLAHLLYEPNVDAWNARVDLFDSPTVGGQTVVVGRGTLWAALEGLVEEDDRVSLAPRGLAIELCVRDAAKDGSNAFLHFPRAEFEEFVFKTFVLVPQGREVDYVDVDRALASILRAAS